MPKAREIMTPQVTCVRENDTLLDAARQMADHSVGALPVCGEDDHLLGMLTDRDIVVRGLAKGHDPKTTTAGQLTKGVQKEAVTIGADDDVDEILRTMTWHKVRRLPVIDGHDLVGIVAQADVARSLAEPKVGELVAALSTD